MVWDGMNRRDLSAGRHDAIAFPSRTLQEFTGRSPQVFVNGARSLTWETIKEKEVRCNLKKSRDLPKPPRPPLALTGQVPLLKRSSHGTDFLSKKHTDDFFDRSCLIFTRNFT